MKKLIHPLILSIIVVLVLASCSFFKSAETPLIAQPTASMAELVTIELAVLADTSVPFTTVDQTIKFNYAIKAVKNGSSDVPPNITVAGATITCPALNTVGNLNDRLDQDETIICTSSYPITQADLDKGSVTNVATAAAYGVNSNTVTTTVATVPAKALTLTKSVDSTTYDHINQTIIYAYVIKNSGSTSLGPAQFTVSDTGINANAPINCGEATTTLASNATVTCSATYTVTQADMAAASVTTTATASGGGVTSSQPASATITKSATAQSNSNFTVGSTIKHQVAEGEWLWQIARCYGSDPAKVVQANPQLSDPAQISPNTTVTVPNIGSAGKIYAPQPCVGTHTVIAGDTWSSIALKYNADASVLQMVNANTITVGKTLKVPLNSAGIKTTDGVTGYCVDLTRNLKLANLNPNVTHFNVCGGTVANATGNMKIGTIKVYQRPEDVGQGGLSQDITMVASVVTSTPINDANSLIVGDMNYDGNDDFRIVEFLPAGPNIPYVYYIFNPATKQFEYNEAYKKITSPEFPGNSQIHSKWRESAVKSGIDTYTIANNIPTLTQRESWEAINATQATHLVTVFNADGTSQVTVNEIVALPIP